MQGFRTEGAETEDERKRRDAEGERGGGHKHGNKNHGPEAHIMAYGDDGNHWVYRPRFFYCKNGNWIRNEKDLHELPYGHDPKDQSECDHAHRGPNFANGCDVEHYDWGSGGYTCTYHAYDPHHHHYNHHVHANKHKHKHSLGQNIFMKLEMKILDLIIEN